MKYKKYLHSIVCVLAVSGVAHVYGAQTEQKELSAQENEQEELNADLSFIIQKMTEAEGEGEDIDPQDFKLFEDYLHKAGTRVAEIINTPLKKDELTPKDYIPYTPFQLSVYMGSNPRIVKILLDNGADVDMPRGQQYPLDILAQEKGLMEEVSLGELLLTYGARRSNPNVHFQSSYLNGLLRLTGVIPSNIEELRAAAQTMDDNQKIRALKMLRSRMNYMGQEETLIDLFIFALVGGAKEQQQYERARRQEERWQKDTKRILEFNQKYRARISEPERLPEADPAATSRRPMSGHLSDKLIDTTERSACSVLEFMKALSESDEKSAQAKVNSFFQDEKILNESDSGRGKRTSRPISPAIRLTIEPAERGLDEE